MNERRNHFLEELEKSRRRREAGEETAIMLT